ncbi:MAG: hypothetical protein EAZ24_02320 [Burkholderiales bacterium]|nr:MAG: hypothetical protein EAZ21_10420 [Betaproteobacteria bacterium]TAG83952.1 MAG: hypothetical protein EAZ24_02320 [Burkholderiales bacterium]
MQANHELCFHVSENATIEQFEPRADATGKPVVWAIDARHLANYLLPRECPRICVRVQHASQLESVPPLLARVGHTIVVETAWAHAIAQAELTVYAFSRQHFSVVDANAGYLQATETLGPLSAERLHDLPAQLAARGSVLRFAESLWPIHDWVSASVLEFSCIRMRNAAPRGAF